MPKFINRDISVTVDSVDLSDHVTAVTIEQSSDEVDVTAMGSAMKETLLGIADATITVTFLQDFEATSVDATLGPLVGLNTPFEVVVKPTSAAVSPTNPSYTMQAVLPSYNALAGSLNEASSTDVTFRNADPSGIVKATA